MKPEFINTANTGAALNAPQYVLQQYNEAASPKQQCFENHALVSNAAPSAAPSAAAGLTMALGGARSGAAFTGHLAEAMFSTVYTAALKTAIDRYVTLRYGGVV